MIKQISLSNFQSHSDSTLNFSDGVNIIVGNSDSGKTAIIRAIRKLVHNKPSGDEMKSHWGGKLQIEMFTDDAHIVYSKDKEAEYILGDTHFKAFGTSVPDEIIKALNLSDVNIQNQLDQPFLLAETPGAVASHFNKVARLDKIDTSTQSINSSIRSINQEVEAGEKQAIAFKEDLKQFEHVEKAEIELEVLEEMEKKLKTAINARERLDTLVSNITEVAFLIKEEAKILKVEPTLNQIFEYKDQVKDLDTKCDKIYGIITSWYNLKDKIEYYKQTLLLEEPVLELLELYKERTIVVDRQKSLVELLSSLTKVKGQIKQATFVHLRLAEKYKEMFPEVCPLCGLPVPHDK